jgi:quinol monooxygenase YgiN
MNARQPLYLRPTANPCADAEAWENEQEAKAEHAEAKEREAYATALKALGAPGSWFKALDIGETLLIARDELACEVLGSDTEATDAYDELMKSPAALAFHEALARCMARKYRNEIAGWR